MTSLYFNLLPIQPILRQPIKQIMLLPRRSPNMPPMPRHIPQHTHAHRQLLTISQTPIPLRKRSKPLLINHRDPIRIDRNQLILLIPMPHQPRAPAAINLFEEKAEPAIRLCIYLAPLDREPLRDRRFHLRHCSCAVRRDVACYTVAPVHDECASVHACF